MQFANATGVQAHIHAGNVLGNTEFSHGDLTGPTAGCQPRMSVREREAQIRKRALIGGVEPVDRDLAVSGEVMDQDRYRRVQAAAVAVPIHRVARQQLSPPQKCRQQPSPPIMYVVTSSIAINFY